MADSEKEQQQNQPTKTEEDQPPKEVIGMFFSIFTPTPAACSIPFPVKRKKNADQPFCKLK